MPRHLLSLFDLTREEIDALIRRGLAFKKNPREAQNLLPGKILGLLFEKTSTRTRVSFEAAILGMGGHPIYMTQQTSQLGRGESYEDTARVLSGYVDAIVMRTFEQTKLERVARSASVPVINALTDLLHPCQLLADLMTVTEAKEGLDNRTVVWLGDGNNMANSWIEAAILFGFRLRLACPREFLPSGLLLDKIRKEGFQNIEVVFDARDAVKGADVLNADTWVSMGQEGKEEARKKKILEPYQLNAGLLSLADPGAIVLHCLPAHRGEEITDEVIDGGQSWVWEEAKNRLHVQKALLELLL